MANYKKENDPRPVIKPTYLEKHEDIEIKGQKIPDPKLHQQISFLKSGIRLLGYGALWFSLDIAVILLILSEVVGIKEELV